MVGADAGSGVLSDCWTYRVESLTTSRRSYDRHANVLKRYCDRSLRVTQSLLSIVKHDDAVYLVKQEDPPVESTHTPIPWSYSS